MEAIKNLSTSTPTVSTAAASSPVYVYDPNRLINTAVQLSDTKQEAARVAEERRIASLLGWDKGIAYVPAVIAVGPVNSNELPAYIIVSDYTHDQTRAHTCTFFFSSTLVLCSSCLVYQNHHLLQHHTGSFTAYEELDLAQKTDRDHLHTTEFRRLSPSTGRPNAAARLLESIVKEAIGSDAPGHSLTGSEIFNAAKATELKCASMPLMEHVYARFDAQQRVSLRDSTRVQFCKLPVC